MKQNDSDRDYSAADVRNVSGVTYRQLNQWEEKGALPPSRESDGKWRKFTLRELFMILVCSQMRSKFGIPVESLKFIKSCMMRPEADHFRAAVQIMALLHLPVFLLTDFKTTFIMDHPFELSDHLQLGLGYGDDKEAGFVLLKVNPLVNRLLGHLDESNTIKENLEGYKMLLQARGGHPACTSEERQVLDLLRNDTYHRVEVFKKNGKLLRAYAHEELADLNDKELFELIQENDYQSIEFKTHDGDVVRCHRRVSFKFENPTLSPENADRKEPGSATGNRVNP